VVHISSNSTMLRKPLRPWTCNTHGAYTVTDTKPKGNHNSGDLGLGGRIILRKILSKYGMRLWTGFN
jgi:hypothetical protein